MYNTTISKDSSAGKIAYVCCAENFNCENIDIKDKAFLLLIVLEGIAVFCLKNQQIIVTAPCFVCFDERENPVLLKKDKLKAKAICFHPQYLNVNMTFELIRSNFYGDIAHTHDMFLLKPFLDDKWIVPIITGYREKITQTFEAMAHELREQRDWYWSCRSRSYFMEIIIMLERLYGMVNDGEIISHEGNNILVDCDKVKRALLFIEANYNAKLTLNNIIAASGTNHTTLTYNFKKQTGQTIMDYLWSYRVKIAAKMLRFTDIPLKDVAVRCGFSTTAHFSRIFKQCTKATPMTFRNEAVAKRKAGLK